MKEKLLSLTNSYIKIKVSGKNVNNFISKLIKFNIYYSDFTLISYREATLNISYNDFEKINKLKTIYEIEIIKYYGKLKILKAIKKNIYLLSFLFLGLILIFFLSNIIFNIEIVSSSTKIKNLLVRELSYYGIKKYALKKDYDSLEKIKKEIIKNNKDSIEWLEIIKSGTKYIVKVEERLINDTPINNNIYDVVASKNAVIKSIKASSGVKIKSVQSYVKKGDTLISSSITLPNGDVIKKSANGIVIGEVWYKVNIEYPKTYHEVIYTGNKKNVLVFNFLNKKIALFNFNKYKTFDKNSVYIFKNNIIPISLEIEKEYEVNIINTIYSSEEALTKAVNLIKKRLMEQNKNIIKVNNYTILNKTDLPSKIKLNLLLEVEEDIGVLKEANKEEK